MNNFNLKRELKMELYNKILNSEELPSGFLKEVSNEFFLLSISKMKETNLEDLCIIINNYKKDFMVTLVKDKCTANTFEQEQAFDRVPFENIIPVKPEFCEGIPKGIKYSLEEIPENVDKSTIYYILENVKNVEFTRTALGKYTGKFCREILNKVVDSSFDFDIVLKVLEKVENFCIWDLDIFSRFNIYYKNIIIDYCEETKTKIFNYLLNKNDNHAPEYFYKWKNEIVITPSVFLKILKTKNKTFIRQVLKTGPTLDKECVMKLHNDYEDLVPFELPKVKIFSDGYNCINRDIRHYFQEVDNEDSYC